MIHRINVFLLSLIIAFAPVYFTTAYASAAEKWTIEEIVYDNVAKNIKIQAEKNYGPSANDNTYKVKVPVTSSAAGSTALSMIRMGVAGVALYGLVEGVGWIIDNGIVKKIDPNEPTIPPTEYYYSLSVGGTTYRGDPDYVWDQAFSNFYSKQTGNAKPDPDVAHTKTINGMLYNLPIYRFCYKNMGGYNFCVDIKPTKNPNYDPEYQPKYVPVSPSEIGDEIINSPAAPQILPDIYNPNNPVSRPSPAPDQAEKSLENAPPIPKENPKGDTNPKPNKDTDGDGIPDAYDPALPSEGQEFELPEFCSWAVTVCEWYTKYKEDSDLAKEHREAEKQVWTQEEIARQEEKQQREDEKSFWQKVEDWFDWTKQDTPLPESDDEIPEIVPEIGQLDTSTFQAVAGCPAPIQIAASGPIQAFTISYEPICQFASKWSFVAPLIGFLSGAMIVIGVGRKGEDADV